MLSQSCHLDHWWQSYEGGKLINQGESTQSSEALAKSSKLHQSQVRFSKVNLSQVRSVRSDGVRQSQGWSVGPGKAKQGQANSSIACEISDIIQYLMGGWGGNSNLYKHHFYKDGILDDS